MRIEYETKITAHASVVPTEAQRRYADELRSILRSYETKVVDVDYYDALLEAMRRIKQISPHMPTEKKRIALGTTDCAGCR